jgi:CspA family cold shock protein
MLQGTVKFFNEAKGFGFIKYTSAANENLEIFVHVSGVLGTIQENDTVSFEIGESKKGPTAINVRVA